MSMQGGSFKGASLLNVKNMDATHLIVNVQGFLSGLGYVAVTYVLQARYVTEGAPLLLVGFLPLIGQIYLCKFLLAPFFDAYRPPIVHRLLGKKMGWIFFCQIGLVVSLIFMALISARTNPFLLICVTSFAALFSASQDVNIDSIRVQLLSKGNLIDGSSFYLLSFRTAVFFAGGVCLYFKKYTSWEIIYFLFSIFFLVGISVCFIKKDLSEPEVSTSAMGLVKSAYRNMKEKPYINMLLCLLFIYGLGDTLTLSVNSVFLLREMNMDIQDYALYANMINVSMLFISSLITRHFLKKLNTFYCLFIFGAAQCGAIFMYLLLTYTGYVKTIAIISIISEGLTGGMVANALVYIISKTVQEPFTATQYAILSAITASSSVFMSPIAAFIVENYSWHIFYSIALFLSFFGIAVIFPLRKFLQNLSSSR